MAAETPPDDLGLVDALAQLSFLVQGLLAGHAATHGLSLSQVRMLGILRDRTPSLLELAALLDLDKSSTSGLVDRAEGRGLVHRVPAADDRRSIRVHLTATGRHQVEAAAAAFATEIGTLTAGLSVSQRAQLSVLATRVVVAGLPGGGTDGGGDRPRP